MVNTVGDVRCILELERAKNEWIDFHHVPARSTQPILEARQNREGKLHLNRVSYTIRKTARFRQRATSPWNHGVLRLG